MAKQKTKCWQIIFMEIFIIYDGIKNSVFEGQVLTPFKTKAKKNSHQKFLIISFEKNILNLNFDLPDNLEIIQLKKLPFLGKISLWLSKLKLKSFLKKINSEYSITARGPLAGWIVLNSINKYCKQVIVQARGICVEEYQHAHKFTKNYFKNLFHKYRITQLRKIEKEVFSNKKIKINSVSNALIEYLHKNYGINKNICFIETSDTPQPISAAQKISWSNEIRNFLGIPTNYTVFCYNGSAKSWQCPKETIEFFEKELKTNKNIFLLILTQEKETFYKLTKNIPEQNFKILTLKHDEILKYLSACDKGIIFREKNIINWVSRPTKALEYKAAHLEIIHNNEIEYLN